MDTSAVLDKYTQDLLNLPLEVKHLFEELKNKDAQLADARKRYQTKDSQIHKFIRANGTLTRHPKETLLYSKMEDDMRLVQKIQREKILLANTALFLVLKHLCNLETDIQKLERDELLAPATSDMFNDDDLRSETARSLPDPSRKKRTYLSMKHRQKRLKSEDYDDFYELGPLTRTHSAAPARIPAAADDADNNLYCFCQRVSFGEMIGCDNDDCRFEWFHWSCVGITSPPKDDEVWYCPDCAPKMEKRKKRKK
ncbi:hypothetical protein PUMCH_004727 [Australozyma saopauloensis]|uniref:Chromatin modification-related protein n=1 Tax=Australozyma saopauloensis TaxID=291208 RepID=A0AAX4HH78_9ASCO|nr:hypothetical protein PUMCH_004727 [[Candida] saopauloensis]